MVRETSHLIDGTQSAINSTFSITVIEPGNNLIGELAIFRIIQPGPEDR
jgi:hypothetical protein